jgi:hypothetical protein
VGRADGGLDGGVEDDGVVETAPGSDGREALASAELRAWAIESSGEADDDDLAQAGNVPVVVVGMGDSRHGVTTFVTHFVSILVSGSGSIKLFTLSKSASEEANLSPTRSVPAFLNLY